MCEYLECGYELWEILAICSCYLEEYRVECIFCLEKVWFAKKLLKRGKESSIGVYVCLECLDSKFVSCSSCTPPGGQYTFQDFTKYHMLKSPTSAKMMIKNLC